MLLASVLTHVAPMDPEAALSWLLLMLPAIGALATSRPDLAKSGPAAKEIGALREITGLVHRGTDLAATLGTALERILPILGMDAGAVRLIPASDAPPVVSQLGFSAELEDELARITIAAGAEGELIRGRSLGLEDLARFGADSLAAAIAREGFPSFSLHPISSENHLLGLLALASRQSASVPDSLQEFLSATTGVMGMAVINTRLRGQSRKISDDLVALHEVNKIISQSLDLEDIIRRIVIEGRRLVKTGQCHLFLLDEREQRLVGSASTQEESLKIRQVEISLSEDSAPVRSLLQKRLITVEDISRLDPEKEPVMQAMGWRAAIFAPLIAKEQANGVLICSDEATGRSFTPEEIARAETLAHQAAIAMENARLFQVVSRSQKEWETTFDAMLDSVSVHDTTGKIIRANVALARRLKTTPPRMIGKYCSEVYNPAELSFAPCRHMDQLQSETLVVEEVELPAMGGTFQVSVSPWYDKNNRLVGCIHVAKDVSNEKLLRQQLIQSEKLSAIGELISGIAHELNNPLTGVMGYSQLLQLRKDLDERARESLLKINNLALRCQKIVQNLLSFARKQKPERTLSSINDMIERTVELRNYELLVNNIEIVRDLDRKLPKTIVDAHQLQQVFLNVITNAEHAMLQAHGCGRLEIRTRHDASNDRIVVEIVDDGPGIPEAHVSKIFDPFFTTKEVGKGTGLGLSLSYGIIKEHGGNIYARSRPAEGTTFVIELPVISRLPDDSSIFPELLPQALEFDNLVRGKRVLIVDDEKYILDFFVEIFRMFPMKIDTARDGRAAVGKLSEQDYDLVITDFKMPQMSGRDLFQWVQKNKPDLAKRIIFITGDTVSAETRAFFEYSPNRYLAKPFKIEEVKEAIQQTLEASA